jgi:hypothetical protein
MDWLRFERQPRGEALVEEIEEQKL